MFQGKVRAAMRWLSGESRGNLLRHDDIVQQQVGDNSKSISVIDALKVLSAEFYFHKPITVHLELYLFYCFIHFLLYIGQY